MKYRRKRKLTQWQANKLKWALAEVLKEEGIVLERLKDKIKHKLEEALVI